MRQDGERWDERYAGRVTGAGVAPKGLDGLEVARAGTCIDVACGLGEQSLWAAARGLDVVALDASPVAIAALRHAAEREGVTARIDARVVDLDDGMPEELEGRCALVICQRFRDPRLYRSLVDVAVDGGVIVVTVLSQVGLSGEAGAFHAPAGELIDAFRQLDVEVLRSLEADGEATLVSRRRRT